MTTLAADAVTYHDTLPADYAGKLYEYRLITTGADGIESAPVTTTGAGIALQSVAFGGTGFQTVSRDNGNGVYGSTQWMDGNLNGTIDPAPGITEYSNQTIDALAPYSDWRFPLSYVRSTAEQESRIVASPVLSQPIASSPLLIRGGGWGFTFPPQIVIGGAASIAANEALPQTIDDSLASIDWEASADGGNSWFELGFSGNHLYVTGAAAPEAFETVLDLGCDGARSLDPTTQRAQVASGIWAGFSGNETRRVDRKLMKYNHDTDTGNTAAAMLSDAEGRGRCDSWADLLVQTLGAQGVRANSVRMDPKQGYSYLEVNAGRAQGTGTQNYDRTIFDYHKVVMVTGYSDRIYDPSFGGSPTIDAVDVRFAYEKARVVRYYRQGWIGGQPVPIDPVDDVFKDRELEW